MKQTRLLFIDRDGTLIQEPEDEQIDSFEKLVFTKGVFRNLAFIAQHTDYELVMVSNQDGLGTDSFPEDTFWPVHNFIIQTLESEGIHFAKQHIDRHFPEDNSPMRKPGTGMLTEYIDYRHGQEVDLLVWQKTDLGFKVIIDNKYGGLVYKDQIFKYIHTGDRMKGYIGTVRPDGKIDVTLQPTGKKLSREFSDALLDYLKENNGYCNLGDKSNAEDIYDRFQVSKKTFKKAIGDLYKRHIITLEEGGMGIVLVEK